MTSISGDPRRILGIPEEDWFHQLAAATDWRALGVADRPDLAEMQRVFGTVWALSEPSLKVSYPNEFRLNPRDPRVSEALPALRAIGAAATVLAIEKALAGPAEESVPPAPEAGMDAARKYEIERRVHETGLRHTGDDVRGCLVRFLDARGVFPLDDSRQRLEKTYGDSPRARALRELQELDRLMKGENT